MNDLVLGIDLGGTKSAASLLTITGEILEREAGLTPAQGSPAVIVPFLGDLALRVLARAPRDRAVIGVGISAGAPADGRRGVVFSAPNLPGWGETGFPLAQSLTQYLGITLPIALENDADATALAEHRFGAGKGVSNLAFLTVGTGIGAGLIVDGALLRGAIGAGGEVGHIPVEPEGRLCACGLRGCLEAYSSGPSLVRVALERGFTGEGTAIAVIAAARSGDPAALSAVKTAGTMLGRGIASLVMLLNPEMVVLGTLAVHAGDLLLPEIEREVAARTWQRLRQNLQIVPAALGDRAQDMAALCAFLTRYPTAAAE
ncbi:MAG: ROK family protein [Armatimonadota bacterium]